MTFLGIKEGMDNEIPNIEDTALNMLDVLKSTFDKGYSNLSLDTALSPDLSREFSSVSNFKNESEINRKVLSNWFGEVTKSP